MGVYWGNDKRGDDSMKYIVSFIKREPVLVAATACAVVSCCFVPPDGAYWSYFDLRTLALLYCLMVVVAGLRQAGLFDRMAHALCGRAGTVRGLTMVLVGLCFVSAMLITNDVALLTFVPFAVAVLTLCRRQQDLIYVVVLQTVAANLGSMLTPVGNPQNLYLYSRYDMAFGDFFAITAPVWGLSLVLLAAACLPVSREKPVLALGDVPEMDRRKLWINGALFIVCLLVVVHVLPWWGMLAIVAAVLAVFDRKALRQADFMLLLTFCAFFIFSGNLGRIEAVAATLRRLMTGHEYPVALLSSQVISNVPAALLLSGFTDKVRPLVLGVNVGGLGTPIASLASLISLKLYGKAEGARTGRYLAVFTLVNVVFLAVLTAAVVLLGA